MSFIVKPIGKRLFKNKFKKYQDKYLSPDPKHDLINEWVEILDVNGRPTGKKREQPRRVPEGISKHDADILLAVRRRAHRYDESRSICGIKYGLSSLVGLVPGFGDVGEVVLALYVFVTCLRVKGGVGWYGILMLLLIIADFVVGAPPFLGDLADTFLRCNKLNAEILNHILKKRGEKNLKELGISRSTTEKPSENNGLITTQPAPTTMRYPTNLQTVNLGPSSRYETGHGNREYSHHTEPTRPEPAQLSSAQNGGRGWFRRILDPHRESDPEQGSRSGELTGQPRFINGDDLRRAKEATAR